MYFYSSILREPASGLHPSRCSSTLHQMHGVWRAGRISLLLTAGGHITHVYRRPHHVSPLGPIVVSPYYFLLTSEGHLDINDLRARNAIVGIYLPVMVAGYLDSFCDFLVFAFITLLSGIAEDFLALPNLLLSQLPTKIKTWL